MRVKIFMTQGHWLIFSFSRVPFTNDFFSWTVVNHKKYKIKTPLKISTLTVVAVFQHTAYACIICDACVVDTEITESLHACIVGTNL